MNTEVINSVAGKTQTPAGRARTIPALPNPKAVATKAATIRKLLARARGATMVELSTATGWQPHSLRAFMSGLRKFGARIAREPRKSGEQSYRLVSLADVSVPDSEAGNATIIVADSRIAASGLA